MWDPTEVEIEVLQLFSEQQEAVRHLPERGGVVLPEEPDPSEPMDLDHWELADATE